MKIPTDHARLNTQFGSILLRQARENAKKAGLKIGHLQTYRYKARAGNTRFQVFEAGRPGPVWSGTAYNARIAKARYLNRRVAEFGETEIQTFSRPVCNHPCGHKWCELRRTV